MAKARPKRIPAITLKKLFPTDFRRMPLRRRSNPVANTSQGGGKRIEGKKWLLAIISQSKKKEMMEMALHFKSVTFIG
jgi:hypothetical protein